MNLFRNIALAAVACAAAHATAAAPAAAKAAPKAKDAKPSGGGTALVQEMCDKLQLMHISKTAPDDNISRRAWTNILDACDSQHMLFDPSDIKEFLKRETSLDDAFKAGDFSFAEMARKTSDRRLAERTAFATNYLAAAKFVFKGARSYPARDYDSRWPATSAERDSLWKLRLESEVLDEYIADEKAGVAKAAAKVAARYADNLRHRLKHAPEADSARKRFMLAIASAYDAHTIYMPPKALKSFEQEMSVSLCGIGASWEPTDDGAAIKRIVPGGPLAKDGRVHTGDTIVSVSRAADGVFERVADKQEDDAIGMFRGEKGTKITLEVRHADGKTEMITLVRDIIPLKEQAASSRTVEIDVAGRKMKAGYLRLPLFYESQGKNGEKGSSCAADLRAELLKLRDDGVCGVLFDLRDNTGGSLGDAVRTISLFVRNGPAVRMVDRHGEVALPVPDDSVVCEVPVVVLTSRGSASAGELVPGTLQDLGRAVVVGEEHTFGKGTAQAVVQFDGDKSGALVVTEGRFYRVTGASTQFRGVESDIVLPSSAGVNELLGGEGKLRYPLPWNKIGSVPFNPSWDLGRFVPALRAASAARVASGGKWEDQKRLVRWAEESAFAKSKSLDLGRRKAQIERQRAVDKERERIGEKGFDPDARDCDIVLDEGLNILADLVRLNGGRKLPAAKPVPVDTSGGLFGGLDDDD